MEVGAASWYIRLRFCLASSLHPCQLQVPGQLALKRVPHLISTRPIGAAQPLPPWHLIFQRATEDLGFHGAPRRREISGEDCLQTWNSGGKKTSWIRFPLLKDLVLESKQCLGSGRPRCVEKNGGSVSDSTCAEDTKTYEQNA